MHFLCPRHRQVLTSKPQEELCSLWFSWMNNAGLHYGLNQYQQALPWMGCAFDMTTDMLLNTRVHRKTAVTKVVLSAIYLNNAYRQQGDDFKADYVMSCTLQRLGMMLHDRKLERWLRTCMALLVDESRHQMFFERYMNLPFYRRPAHMAPTENSTVRAMSLH